MQYLDSLDNSEVIKNTLFKIFENERTKYNYSKDNLQTMAVTIHPHFTVWLASLQLLELGGKAIKHNTIEEIFGTNVFNEGPHSLLALKTFGQLGPYTIHHYERCQGSIRNVYEYANPEKINVLYAFMICCELSSFLYIDWKAALIRFGVKDLFYFDVHLQADNLNDGHGIQMLNALSTDTNMTIWQFNQGIQLFIDFFGSIFIN
ncbi:hypothetical protein CYY_007568 [Polysphondylium violaceum]|uniref:Uncharacterized protein n=1 Tax=Polysphondylium violaceum TaxID=133409 RepID=A0A8J4PP37_9MYCE|nr:hypothetical protein CYY_007568 [Polysphondylium violaceum]